MSAPTINSVRPFVSILCGHCMATLVFEGDHYECPRCMLGFAGDDEPGYFLDPATPPCGRRRAPSTMHREDSEIVIDYEPCDLPATHLSDHHLVGVRRAA